METATKTPQEARSTDRVLQALSTLAALLDRTINEVQSLDGDFQKRLLQAVHDTESSLQSQAAQHLDEALAEQRTKLEEQFNTKVAELTAQWNAERQRLNETLARATQAATEWEAERARLNTEIDRLKQAEAGARAAAQKAVEDAKASAAAASKASAAAGPAPLATEEVLAEVEKVEALIKQISVLIEDSSTELSTVIRKNVERAELESYLKGIRFAITGPKHKK